MIGNPRYGPIGMVALPFFLLFELLGPVVEVRRTLPAPALGHGGVVAEIDRCLAGGRLALTGNYFAGLAIEDCVGRSLDEWRRVGELQRSSASQGPL